MSLRRRLVGLTLAALALTACGGAATPIPDLNATFSAPTQMPTITPTARATLPPTWTPPAAATPTCGQMVARVAATARQTCAEAQIGEACFVAPRAHLIPRAGASLPTFATPGDRASLLLAEGIETLAFDPASNTWGLAILRALADPPGVAPGQWVTIVLYGEALLSDTGEGASPFQNTRLRTAESDPQCSAAPLPGALIQNATGQAAELTLNGLAVRFDNTIWVRTVPSQRAEVGVLPVEEMQIAVLQGEMLTTSPDDGTPLTVPSGTVLHGLLGRGPDGMQISGAITIEPLAASTAFLPLAALPVPIAIGPQAFATDVVAVPPTITLTPTETPVLPFYGTPPNGVYLTYRGPRITPQEDAYLGTLPQGGRAIWVFEPVGVAPDSVDFFEVRAMSDWDPAITIESATWGVFEANYDESVGPLEAYTASLAGSGGDWRIIIRDANGGGGPYQLRYQCRGECGG